MKYNEDDTYMHHEGSWKRVINIKDDKRPMSEGGGNFYHVEGVKEPIHQDSKGKLASGAMLNAGHGEKPMEKTNKIDGANLVPVTREALEEAGIEDTRKKPPEEKPKMDKADDWSDHFDNDKEAGDGSQPKPKADPDAPKGKTSVDDWVKAGGKVKKVPMDKAEYEKDLSITGKRGVREDRRIDVAAAKTPKIGTRLRDYKAGKEKIIKALLDEGYRESALLLKNWDEMDTIAENIEKSLK